MTNRKPSSLGTVGTFLREGDCSNTLFCVLDRACGHPMKNEERASLPFAGGLMQHGYQCGMLWGAALAAGARACREFGPTPLAESKAIVAAKRLVDAFRARTHEINCFEITSVNKSASAMKLLVYFIFKAGAARCFSMSAGYARTAYDEIDKAMAEAPVEVPAAPVSCAAELIHKMGASEEHATVAAGLAGGIGLCGGACGALGAAIWLKTLRTLEAGAAKPDFKSPQAQEVIDRFLKHTGYEFDCAKIVGRKFESPSDHAAHVRSGGCSKLIEVLAAA